MRGNGRLFKQKNSRYWWAAFYVRGREVRESTKTEDEKQAWRFLKNRMREVGADAIGARVFIGPKQQRILVGELLDSLKADYELRGKWNGPVESSMDAVREYLGAMRAVDVTREVVGQMIENWLAENYAKATVNRRTQLLSQAFKLALRDGKLSRAPFIPHLSEVGNAREGFFERGDFEAVLEHLPEHLQDPSRWGYITGWRKGSIVSLEWTDVGDDVVTLRAKNAKQRKPETVPLVGELRDIIERRRAAHLVESNGETSFATFVFHDNGKPITDFRRSWASACQRERRRASCAV